MHRYQFVLSRPYIDAESLELALKNAIDQGILRVVQTEIPRKAQLTCHVTKTPNASGMYSASARFERKPGEIETVATADAPSAERALRALGYENPGAHTCSIYRRRFGDNYELVLAK